MRQVPLQLGIQLLPMLRVLGIRSLRIQLRLDRHGDLGVRVRASRDKPGVGLGPALGVGRRQIRELLGTGLRLRRLGRQILLHLPELVDLAQRLFPIGPDLTLLRLNLVQDGERFIRDSAIRIRNRLAILLTGIRLSLVEFPKPVVNLPDLILQRRSFQASESLGHKLLGLCHFQLERSNLRFLPLTGLLLPLPPESVAIGPLFRGKIGLVLRRQDLLAACISVVRNTGILGRKVSPGRLLQASNVDCAIVQLL